MAFKESETLTIRNQVEDLTGNELLNYKHAKI